MILYSIIPPEIVFAQLEQETPASAFREIDYMGKRVQVSVQESGMVIQRVLSSQPKDYLNPALQPGTVIQNIGT